MLKQTEQTEGRKNGETDATNTYSRAKFLSNYSSTQCHLWNIVFQREEANRVYVQSIINHSNHAVVPR